ncbi:SULT1C4 [Cervus elaphus hippelaphus]|uniref:SULT1C4 n=1 Tax=Cervus elaphus hippelaphus TaxID=46360 RepID=A0A212CX05_CEREH|nr:SULT1C4 [Cervus elaphus hippelaphus]
MCHPPLLPGVIRDWKNQFTDAQTKKFNEDYEKHMADTSLSFHMHSDREEKQWTRSFPCLDPPPPDSNIQDIGPAYCF